MGKLTSRKKGLVFQSVYCLSVWLPMPLRICLLSLPTKPAHRRFATPVTKDIFKYQFVISIMITDAFNVSVGYLLMYQRMLISLLPILAEPLEHKPEKVI